MNCFCWCDLHTGGEANAKPLVGDAIWCSGKRGECAGTGKCEVQRADWVSGLAAMPSLHPSIIYASSAAIY
jgi:hypothetical protein